MLFKLGLFLLPFENLFFAPSSGWAAIAPLCFFCYILLNLNITMKKINKEIVLGIITIFIISFISYIYYFIEVGNLMKNISTIVLGISFYLALKVRYLNNNNFFLKDIDFLFNSYFISFLIGVVQFISYKLNIGLVIKILEITSKRFYYPRVQFTFTEPSFISCHLYGILLVLILFCRKNNIRVSSKNYNIFFCWVVGSNLLAKSSRLALDTLIVLGIVIFYYAIFINKNKTKYIYIISFILSIGLISNSKSIIKKYDKRLYLVMEKGVYSDASLASRYFRINASIKGYKKKWKTLFLGHGIGNLYIPLNEGYIEAKKEYDNEYMSEVNSLKESKPTSLFSMPIKIISEFGIIVFLLILVLLFSKKYFDIYIIMLYIYTQFDSYAFYTVWIYIFLRKFLKKRKMNYKFRRRKNYYLNNKIKEGVASETRV